jgi:predicted nucleotidyltransferase
MGRRLVLAADKLECSERTLRRYVNDGLLHGERGSRQEVRLARGEESYLRQHGRLLHGLRRVLRTEPSVRLAVLFGSTATGEDGPESDIDVLVDLESGDILQLLRLQRRLQSGLDGRAVHLVLLSDAERAPALLADVLREGRVIVDRGGPWQGLNRRRKEIFKAADAEDEATREAAWQGVYEASRRLGA